MDINDLTVGQLKEIRNLCGITASESKRTPFIVGKKYFIRTVTLYYTGELKEIYADALVLEKASWIPGTGRFYDFLKNGTPNEVEPFVDPVIIPMGSIVDATEWQHKLLKDQK